MSLYFSAVNRNKRSITLDLKHTKGRNVLYELVKSSDILWVTLFPAHPRLAPSDKRPALRTSSLASWLQWAFHTRSSQQSTLA